MQGGESASGPEFSIKALGQNPNPRTKALVLSLIGRGFKEDHRSPVLDPLPGCFAASSVGSLSSPTGATWLLLPSRRSAFRPER